MRSNGQTSDWSKAYTQYRPDVLGFLRSRLWSRQDLAEDLTQETFARAMTASTPLRDPSRIRQYLLQIANNLMIDHIRRHPRVASESDLGPGADLEAHADDGAADPLEASHAAQFREAVERLVAEMPEDMRIAFERGVLQRVPYGEIAKEHGWTLAKVKSCVLRARKTLIPVLEDFR